MKESGKNTWVTLLTRIFDYAGMFPPASLTFEEALLESSSFSSSLTRPWMIANDIVLDAQYARKLIGVNLGIYSLAHPLRLCLIATEEPESVIATVRHLLCKEPQVAVTSLEMKAIPLDFPDTIGFYNDFATANGIQLVLEPDLSGDDWESALTTAITKLQQTQPNPALKCRLTGPQGISADRLATAIRATCNAHLPLKITGGLHHPIVESDRYPFPMGFLNVAAGVMFRQALGGKVPHTRLVEILTNQDIDAYTFGESLRFKDYEISHAELISAKERQPFTIGTCSLREPDEDLSRLFGTPDY
jgi:hypothetical protein